MIDGAPEHSLSYHRIFDIARKLPLFEDKALDHGSKLATGTPVSGQAVPHSFDCGQSTIDLNPASSFQHQSCPISL